MDTKRKNKENQVLDRFHFECRSQKERSICFVLFLYSIEVFFFFNSMIFPKITFRLKYIIHKLIDLSCTVCYKINKSIKGEENENSNCGKY